jgi:electron transport complex protein RnfC
VHATVPGRVIRRIAWKDGEGVDHDALVIRMEGAFEKLGKKEEIFPWASMQVYDMQRVISEYGVVEMEHRGRPLTELISAYRNSGRPLTLVVRCVFDDPWLAADYVLCRERLNAVVEGSFIMARACANVERVVFAVSFREKELGEQMLAAASQWGLPASMVLVGNRYPQRSRRELELVLRAHEKKEGLSLGDLIYLGPATLAAVYDAIKLKKPALERYVAVGGSALRRPQVMKIRIGKRIGDVIEECGGFLDKPMRIATGSPIFGRIVTNLDEPVVKTCYAIVAMLKSQIGDYAERNCISCGDCREVCPVGLDPEELYKQITGRRSEQPAEAESCHGCGCCEVVCPSRLPLSWTIMGERLGVYRD